MAKKMDLPLLTVLLREETTTWKIETSTKNFILNNILLGLRRFLYF